MIKISIKNYERLLAYLRSVPLGVKAAASRAFAEYLLGDESHGLRHYPGYKHVPYSAIGGFISDRQRRYVMARIREGSIVPGTPVRNGNMRNGWTMGGEPPRYTLKNDVSYAGYLVGDNNQSLHSQKQGWRTVSKNISDNLQGALRHAVAAVNAYLKQRKG